MIRSGFGHSLLGMVFVLGACAPAATQPPATSEKSRGDECGMLHERVTTVAVRLTAMSKEKESAAKYHAIADVMGKLSQDLDRPFKDSSVGALASDYREAAKAVAASTHDAAGLLDSAEAAKARIPGLTKQFGEAVDHIAKTCRGSSAADCAQVVKLLSSLGGGRASATRVQTVSMELGSLSYSTPELREQVGEARPPLDGLGENLTTAERIEKDATLKLSTFARATSQFGGLSERANQMCGAAAH